MDSLSFIFSKIIWVFLSPLNFIFLLLIASSVFFVFRRMRSFALFLMSCAVFLALLCGFSPLGHNLLVHLENQYEQSEETLDSGYFIAGVIVLGGAFETDLTQAREASGPVINDNIERVVEGIQLSRRFPSAVFVYSGGEGKILSKDYPESKPAAQFMDSIGYDSQNVLFEDQSRNTWENAALTKDLVGPMGYEHWIVVTSAYHMPRAMRAFKAAGWKYIIPWPVDYRTDGRVSWWPRPFDVLGNFYKTHLALHEYAGQAFYLLKSKGVSDE